MEQIPEWEYLSDKPGLKGKLKEQVNDFFVEENASHETDEEGDHLIVKLRKQNMTTMEAVNKLSSMLHVSDGRIGYAGNKDKRAVTEQYLSIKGIDESDIHQIFTDEFDLEVIGRGNRIGLGNLDYNHFEIVVRDLNLPKESIKNRAAQINEELDGKFPNYFGGQRFGSARPITHQVGKLILQGNYEEAVWTYIAKPYDQEYKSIRKVREELWETREVEGAAEKFPKHYKYEKALLYHLTKSEEDYQGAIKRLPDGLQQLFIHAYQSWIFNKTLSRLLEDGWYEPSKELPLVGYKTEFRNDREDEIMEEVLESEEISREAFRLQDFPELRSEGSYRRAFADYRNFNIIEVSEDELNMNRNKMGLAFDLPKGAYATVLAREFTKQG